VCACVHACLRACVRACVRVCVGGLVFLHSRDVVKPAFLL
jgi:hypothetical protein